MLRLHVIDVMIDYFRTSAVQSTTLINCSFYESGILYVVSLKKIKVKYAII